MEFFNRWKGVASLCWDIPEARANFKSLFERSPDEVGIIKRVFTTMLGCQFDKRGLVSAMSTRTKCVCDSKNIEDICAKAVTKIFLPLIESIPTSTAHENTSFQYISIFPWPYPIAEPD